MHKSYKKAWTSLTEAQQLFISECWHSGPQVARGLPRPWKHAILETGLVFDEGDYIALTDFGISVAIEFLPRKSPGIFRFFPGWKT